MYIVPLLIALEGELLPLLLKEIVSILGETVETFQLCPCVVCATLRGEFPHIAVEYSDVFPEDLPSLSPMRDIEFIIDLVPGTAHISITPYRMVLSN